MEWRCIRAENLNQARLVIVLLVMIYPREIVNSELLSIVMKEIRHTSTFSSREKCLRDNMGEILETVKAIGIIQDFISNKCESFIVGIADQISKKSDHVIEVHCSLGKK